MEALKDPPMEVVLVHLGNSNPAPIVLPLQIVVIAMFTPKIVFGVKLQIMAMVLANKLEKM